MGSRSRYAMLPDRDMLTELTLTSRWPSPERRDWNLQTVACAAGGVPGDSLTVTLTLVQGTGELCFVCLRTVPPTPLAINPSSSNAPAFCFRGSFGDGLCGDG